MVEEKRALKQDDKDFLIKQLEKSGFTLERYIVNILAKDDWAVTPNGHFHDKDQDKDREIDVLAEKEVYLGDQGVLLTFYLVIECKKIPDKAWIFFPGPCENGVGMIKAPELLSLLDCFKLDSESLPLPFWDMHSKNGFFSSGFSEIFVPAWKLDNKNALKDKTDNIFEAITKVMKAAESMREVFLNSESVTEKVDFIKSGRFSEWVEEGSPMNFGFVFPIIAFEGSMYSATFPLNRNHLNRVNLVNYQTRYNSGIYDLFYNIDIIEKSFIIDYFSRLNKDLKALEKEYMNDSTKNSILKKIGGFLRS